MGISPAINPRASWDFRWLIRNLHENYLVTDFPAADFLAGTDLTALAAFTVLLGGNDFEVLAIHAKQAAIAKFELANVVSQYNETYYKLLVVTK